MHAYRKFTIILPNFNQLFLYSGMDLPELTLHMLNFGGLYLLIGLIFLSAFILNFLYSISQIKSALYHLDTSLFSRQKLLGFSIIKQQLLEYLKIGHCIAGKEINWRNELTLLNDDQQKQLNLASDIGDFKDELLHQLHYYEKNIQHGLHIKRQILSIIGFIYVSVTIGIYIIALYLPLFSLANVL